MNQTIEERFHLGAWVQTMREFSGVPKFTQGIVVEDYGTGVTIAWDKPDRPLPQEMTAQEIGEMRAVNPKCPLRDGFDKKDELPMLVKITGVTWPQRPKKQV